jgi:hypothetical protein
MRKATRWVRLRPTILTGQLVEPGSESPTFTVVGGRALDDDD